jgi:hypothetical protein
MKTNTYLRWSLLIPFVVWGVSLLIFMIASIFSFEAFPDGESLSAVDIPLFFLLFYVFGIIVWIFPYLLVALILFFWSFISKARTALQVFALSPVVMTLLTVATLTILTLGISGGSTGIIDQYFIGFNLLGAAFTLIWGYICVGIGYGIYRFLQKRGLIRDEANMEVPIALNEPA